MSNKFEELLNTAKLNELIRKKLDDEKKSCIMWGLAILGAVAFVGVIAYAVYKHFTPDYLEDFEDDFDDFDDDFFEDVDDSEE